MRAGVLIDGLRPGVDGILPMPTLDLWTVARSAYSRITCLSLVVALAFGSFGGIGQVGRRVRD
jgi:hypothetical protein